MGFGDDLMITAFAELEKKKHPEKQLVIGNLEEKKMYHSIIYNNNPNICPIGEIDRNKPIHFINYHERNRPYIDYTKSNNQNWSWNTFFSPTPGKLYFTKDEISNAHSLLNQAKEYWNKKNSHKYKGIIFFESTSTKTTKDFYYYKMKNKDWGFENWKQLILRLKDDFLLIQSIHENSIEFENVFYASEKFDFRTACALIQFCDLFIGPEGGFGHAAAALSKKAVLYFGGWIHPKVTGYSFHENIYYEDVNSPCGSVGYECKHCEDARNAISVDYFEKKIYSILDKD
tara:strand:+ start:32702 stop:33562 length:861 start_codon:yes stop_codon:yes gene_type:complete